MLLTFPIISIFIFPEGSRNKTENTLTEFKRGSEIIARKSKLDILPVYIKTNTNDVLMASLSKSTKDLVIEIEIGDVISFCNKRKPLEEIYKSKFALE